VLLLVVEGIELVVVVVEVDDVAGHVWMTNTLAEPMFAT